MSAPTCHYCQNPIDPHHYQTLWPDTHPHHLQCVIRLLVDILKTLDHHTPAPHIPDKNYLLQSHTVPKHRLHNEHEGETRP